MKKLSYFVAMIATTMVFFASCEKDEMDMETNLLDGTEKRIVNFESLMKKKSTSTKKSTTMGNIHIDSLVWCA
ncbi:MAG: hypothetical protein PF489_15905 [Salinivirgaceae bacterium]|jgi:hypothetical protein|nr:hypothetical protein [Salinivirgaceae bacterium]